MFWLLPLAGAAIGAMTSKDKLKGALLGAGAGAMGGAGAGLLGAGAAGAGTAGGLLSAAGGTGAAGGLTAATGAGTALTGATSGAMGLKAGLGAGTALASSSAAPALTAAAGSGTQLAAASGAAPGLLSQVGEYAKPVMQSMQAAQGLMGGDEQPPAQPMQKNAAADLSGILQSNQQAMQMTDEDAKRRKQELEQFAMNMMGGYRG